MAAEQCYRFVCFVPLSSGGQKFFGFSEFLAALALMVLAWTIADVRYRFRIRTAPLPLQGLTFSVVGVIGVLALLTDWWRAEQWLVPKGNLLTPAAWQALLGGLLLLTFLTWVWFAFIKPAVFSRWNALRFTRALYLAVLKGSPTELPEIADELTRSAKRLIAHSWQFYELEARQTNGTSAQQKADGRWLHVRGYAFDILRLIADRRFCRHIVRSSPVTALALFEEMRTQHKFDLPLGTFAKNITAEAIADRDSFVYQEVHGYDTGIIGQHKPLTQALYGDCEIVHALNDTFDVDYRERDRWEPDQLEAFCRIVLLTFKSYVRTGMHQHSFVLFRAFGNIERTVGGLYKLNGVASDWSSHTELRQLSVIVDFVTEAVTILDEAAPVKNIRLKRRRSEVRRDVYDLVAGFMFELILAASSIKEPRDVCWAVQHNAVWGQFFGFAVPDGPAAKIVGYKLRRLIYDEIAELSKWRNFKGSRILGMMLNVMGLKEHAARPDRSTRPLHRAVLNWTKKNYARMAAESPKVAADCLVEGLTYDAAGPRLIETGMQILDREPRRTVLDLDPAE